jgi:hypothetical protein
MRKAVLFVAAVTMAAVSAQAQMGWTLKQCTDKFGSFKSKESIESNRTDYKWDGDRLAPMEVIFIHGNPLASRVILSVATKPVTSDDFANFVKLVCPGFTWHDILPYNGANFALLSNGSSVYWGGWGENWISAWTEADDEVAKRRSCASPKRCKPLMTTGSPAQRSEEAISTIDYPGSSFPDRLNGFSPAGATQARDMRTQPRVLTGFNPGK